MSSTATIRRRAKTTAAWVNTRHHKRLMALLDSGDIVIGGEADEADRYIAPTILKNVSPESPVMRDEIFGPILPVLPVDDVNDAVRFINGAAETARALCVQRRKQRVRRRRRPDQLGAASPSTMR